MAIDFDPFANKQEDEMIFFKAKEGANYAEEPFSFNKTQDGSVILKKNYVGDINSMMAIFDSVSGGEIATVQGDSVCPISGSFIVQGASLSYVSAGIVRCEVSFTTGSGGSSSSDEKMQIREEVSFERIEQPITEASFWRAANFSRDDERKALKAIEAYLAAATDADGLVAAREAVGEGFEWILETDAWVKMLKKRQLGISAFWIPVANARKEEQLTRMPNDFGEDVGKRGATPDMSKVSVPSGNDWLGGGDTITWDGSSFSRSRYWVGAEYWDSDLYPPKG